MAWTPHDLLRPILSRGGEIALGLAYSLGKPAAFIEKLFVRRFRLTDPVARAELESLSRAGQLVASQLSMLPAESMIPMERIPENPLLFDGGTEGRRIMAVGDVSHDAGNTWYQKRIALPDEIAWGELQNQMLQLLEQMLTWQPPSSKKIEPEDKVEPAIRMHFIERAY